MGDPKSVSTEAGPHSFIVKIWPEETDRSGKWMTWRGLITHVPSGGQRHFQNLDDVPAFIGLYLQTMGITLRVSFRLWQWLRRARIERII
jgi:hypothetical protein